MIRWEIGEIVFMNRKLLILGLLAVGASSQAVWYTSEAAFMAAISAPNYTEDFSNFSFGTPLNGSQTTWAAPGANGFGWTASANAANTLYSNNSALSLNTANTTLIFTSTGNSFTAFGGRFANSDVLGAIIAGSTLISINGGAESMSVVNAAGQEAFLGWVGGFTINTASALSSGTTNNWAQADHVIVANAVPEPATMAALGLGAVALIRRRRNSK